MLERARTNVVMLCDLSGVTLYPPHYSPLCDKQKQKNRMLTFDFSQPKPSKNGPWDKQLVFVPKTQTGPLNAMAFLKS